MGEATIGRRLARPLTDLRSSYDAIVIGSGYGGGVAAARLARLGLSVAVLERGRELLPGDFPRTPHESKLALQINSALGRVGQPTALFDVRAGRGAHAVVGCGLGGTSLINANVCLIPNAHVLLDARWPAAVRTDNRLKLGFGLAGRMLRPAPLPPSSRPLKLDALAASARALGAQLERVPLHIAFADGKNAAGVVQPACTQCGDCMGGCNVGAKTTVHNTYLADAADHGAAIFTELAVRYVEPAADGRWRVVFHINDHPDRPAPVRAITATHVVIAAGTLGSNELLMRSRERGLALSDRLGKGVSTNADAIAFASNNKRPVNGIGIGHPPRRGLAPPGPAVAGLIDLRGNRPLDEGLVVVEASIQSAMAPLLPLLFSKDQLIGTDTGDGDLGAALEAAGRRLDSLADGAYTGSIRNLQTFLAVGHDGGTGEIVMEHDRALIDWPDAARQAVYGRIEKVLIEAVRATGGTYVPNPATLKLLGGNIVTVHPLGGACMADERAAGVVDDRGRVFDGGAAGANGVHKGLYVLDGSVLPRSVGVHPLFTITAVAERAMGLFARHEQPNTQLGT